MMAEQRADEEAMREMYGIGEYAPKNLDGEGQEDLRGNAVDPAEGEGEEAEDEDEGSEFILDGEDADAPPKEGEEDLTPFERRQKEMLRKMQRIEDERVGQKHWALRGETHASQRDKNALLDEVLDFDTTQRARPLITAEVTADLEERIKRRVGEGRFDDVVRRAKRSTAADLKVDPSRQTDLHAKSKVGLADLYEKEWLERHRKQLEEAGETAKELTEEEKEELKVIQMWKVLASNLDTLSNFHFTPRPAASDELQIRASQKSAIAMEEVTPGAVSTAQLLAPQDLAAPSAKKHGELGETELTTADRKRVRKAKKEAHRKKETRKKAQASAKVKEATERPMARLPRHIKKLSKLSGASLVLNKKAKKTTFNRIQSPAETQQRKKKKE